MYIFLFLFVWRSCRVLSLELCFLLLLLVICANSGQLFCIACFFIILLHILFLSMVLLTSSRVLYCRVSLVFCEVLFYFKLGQSSLIHAQFLYVQLSHRWTWSWSHKTSSFKRRFGGYWENNQPHCSSGSMFDLNFKACFNCVFGFHLMFLIWIFMKYGMVWLIHDGGIS